MLGNLVTNEFGKSIALLYVRREGGQTDQRPAAVASTGADLKVWRHVARLESQFQGSVCVPALSLEAKQR